MERSQQRAGQSRRRHTSLLKAHTGGAVRTPLPPWHPRGTPFLPALQPSLQCLCQEEASLARPGQLRTSKKTSLVLSSSRPRARGVGGLRGKQRWTLRIKGKGCSRKQLCPFPPQPSPSWHQSASTAPPSLSSAGRLPARGGDGRGAEPPGCRAGQGTWKARGEAVWVKQRKAVLQAKVMTSISWRVKRLYPGAPSFFHLTCFFTSRGVNSSHECSRRERRKVGRREAGITELPRACQGALPGTAAGPSRHSWHHASPASPQLPNRQRR